MALFSERNKYITPPSVAIRGEMPDIVITAISNAFIELEEDMRDNGAGDDYVELERMVWTRCLNKDVLNFGSKRVRNSIIYGSLHDVTLEWYRKMDIVEFFIEQMRKGDVIRADGELDLFIQKLNSEFERVNFGYRIVNDIITDITSDEEIKAVEDALNSGNRKVKNHLNQALALYSQRPNPDWRNCIKESISAVEAICRDMTGEKDLGRSLSNLQSKGVTVNKNLKKAFDNLYSYTNDKESGVRQGHLKKRVYSLLQ